MSFTSWLQNLRTALAPDPGHHDHRRRGSLRVRVHRPDLEVLEHRCLLTFNPAVSYQVGTNPHSVVTADFDNDGKLDLAVARYGGDVSVLLGNGDGTFDAAQTSTTGSFLSSLAVGDFDSDGNLDLASASYYDQDVRVLMGDGTGRFSPGSRIGLGSTPNSVAVGDFNGDGLLDLGVASNYYVYYYAGDFHPHGYTNVLLGNGDGSFSGPNVTWLGPGYHFLVAAANLNGDNFDDLVTVDAVDNTGSLLLGDSSGYLQGPSSLSTGSARPIAAGDLDADGDTDLVTASFADFTVGVMLGDGSGNFVAGGSYFAGDSLGQVVLGDFTADGTLDVVTWNRDRSERLAVLYGGGDGAFSSPVHSAVGSYAFSVAPGDFDCDGWLDVVTVNYGGGEVSVLINDRAWPTPAPSPPAVRIDDVRITEGHTGATLAVFTVTLSHASDQNVTVGYATFDYLGAVAGSDYEARVGLLTIPAGQTSATIGVPIYGDRIGEQYLETFFVTLTDPTNAFLDDDAALGTIVDDDPWIYVEDAQLTEGNSGTSYATFTVTLTSAYDEPVTIGYATANGTAAAGSDYQAASSALTFGPGETSKTISVLVNGDRLVEPNEIFFVNLSPLANANVADGQAAGVILDDEPRVSISDVTRYEDRKNRTTLFTFTITLSAAYDEPVTMSFATVNGTATTGDNDYVAKSGTLTFAPGETTKTITIEVKGDNKKEANETFYLDLFDLSSNALFTKNRGIGTILNDD